MESNYRLSKTGKDMIIATGESLTALAEIVATDCSTDIKMSEVGRDGLSNLLAMLADKLAEAVEMLDQEERKGGRYGQQ